MNTRATLAVRILLLAGALLCGAIIRADADELSEKWSAENVSVQERAAAVNRAFTNGTPIPVIVRALGTNYGIFAPISSLTIDEKPERPKTSGLWYSFGKEAVIINTTADISADPVAGKFTRASEFFVVEAKPSNGRTPSDDTSLFQNTTNIVFRFFDGVEKDKSGQEITKWKKFSVSDPEQIKKLVSAIKLEPGQQLSDEHSYDVTFQKPSGEILVHFCPKCFVIVDSQQPYRYRHFAMPKEFYAEFRKLARRQGWKVESK